MNLTSDFLIFLTPLELTDHGKEFPSPGEKRRGEGADFEPPPPLAFLSSQVLGACKKEFPSRRLLYIHYTEAAQQDKGLR